MTVNAVVAATTAEAERAALPNLLAMLALRTGAELRPQLLIEDAEQVVLPPAHANLVEAMRRRWVIGDPDTARARIRELADTFGVDEVMVHPVAGVERGTDPGTSPGREQTLTLLGGAG